MSINNVQRNRLFNRLSVAARTALKNPHRVELARFIGSGPSIRARARLALVAVFLVAAPTLFIGVMRTESVSEHAAKLSVYDDYWKLILGTHLVLKELDLALWAYIYEPEFENAQASQVASDRFRSAVAELHLKKPPDLDLGPPGFFESMASRLDLLIKRSIANDSSLAPARLSIMTISSELRKLEQNVVEVALHERKEALGALSTVGRDQLILFLVLLFALPIFVAFVPNWLVMPLNYLKKIIAVADTGQFRDFSVEGRDEVASLSRVLRAYFVKHEEMDQKKSSKVFEMRNILRCVVSRVGEAVFIVDPNMRINYTNEAAAALVGLLPHQMEGTLLMDCLFSPGLKKIVEGSLAGEVLSEFSGVKVEMADGREFSLVGKIGTVRNRDGDVSRAVIVAKNSAEGHA
jgi:PAS domain S-box-containing protein